MIDAAAGAPMSLGTHMRLSRNDASVAIAVSPNSVEPAPVEVQRYRSVLDDARCVGEACRHWKRWVDLCDIFPFLLRKREQRKCGDGKSGGAHCPAFVKEFVKEFVN